MCRAYAVCVAGEVFLLGRFPPSNVIGSSGSVAPPQKIAEALICIEGRIFLSYRKNVLLICGLFLLCFLASGSSVFAFSSGPPDEKTGAPTEGTCAQVGCHAGNDLNASGGSLILEIPETYIPNEVYTIVVKLARTGQSRWGFEITALDADAERAGSFAADTAANTQLSETSGKQYIKHTTIGTAQGTTDEHSWEFQWTAPDADIGPVTFYATGNASNGNFNPVDDYIYTASEESTPPIPIVAGVSLEIVGDTALTTMNAVEGVNYTLTVTNTGNMMDTLTLEASAEVGIEGSVLGTLSDSEIVLEAGASAELTLKVAGDLLTEPGDYVIGVTATSVADNTKTAEITTTTTIEEMPPPPPPPTPWDVNDDGTVNIQDLVLVASQFGQSGEALKGDINGDGTVNILDLVVVSSHFGEDTSQ